MRTIWLAALLCACSANDTSEPETGPIVCASGECSGSYLERFSQISGDCGPIEDAVTQFNGLDDFGDCTVFGSTWSDDWCQVDAQLECPRADGRTVTVVGASEQIDDACDQVITVATYRLYETDGMLLCSGTYRIEYTRL